MTVARLTCTFLMLVASMLSGCGQKGPLTLTPPQSESSGAVAVEEQAGEERAEGEEEPSDGDG